MIRISLALSASLEIFGLFILSNQTQISNLQDKRSKIKQLVSLFCPNSKLFQDNHMFNHQSNLDLVSHFSLNLIRIYFWFSRSTFVAFFNDEISDIIFGPFLTRVVRWGGWGKKFKVQIVTFKKKVRLNNKRERKTRRIKITEKKGSDGLVGKAGRLSEMTYALSLRRSAGGTRVWRWGKRSQRKLVSQLTVTLTARTCTGFRRGLGVGRIVKPQLGYQSAVSKCDRPWSAPCRTSRDRSLLVSGMRLAVSPSLSVSRDRRRTLRRETPENGLESQGRGRHVAALFTPPGTLTPIAGAHASYHLRSTVRVRGSRLSQDGADRNYCRLSWTSPLRWHWRVAPHPRSSVCASHTPSLPRVPIPCAHTLTRRLSSRFPSFQPPSLFPSSRPLRDGPPNKKNLGPSITRTPRELFVSWRLLEEI